MNESVELLAQHLETIGIPMALEIADSVHGSVAELYNSLYFHPRDFDFGEKSEHKKAAVLRWCYAYCTCTSFQKFDFSREFSPKERELYKKEIAILQKIAPFTRVLADLSPTELFILSGLPAFYGTNICRAATFYMVHEVFKAEQLAKAK